MLRTRDLEEEVNETEIDFTSYEDEGRVVNQVSMNGKHHVVDAEGDALVRQYQRSVDDQTLDADLVSSLVAYILCASRRFMKVPSLPCDSWVVSLLILRPFGLRAGTRPTTRAPSSCL